MRRTAVPLVGPRAPRRVPGLRWVFAVSGVLALVATACAMGGGPREVSGPLAVIEAPPIRQGLRDEAEARATAALLNEGEELYRAGGLEAALQRAREVEERYPEAQGSSLALWLDARVSARLDDWETAASAVGSYLGLVGPLGPNYDEALLLHAGALWETGGDALSPLLAIPASAQADLLAEMDSLAIAIGRGLDTSTLESLIATPSGHPRLRPAFVVEMAVRRYLGGAETEGRQLAEQALAMAPGERVAARARSVIEGRVEEENEVSGVMGGILANTGSPALQQLSQEIQEGIEVAFAEVGGVEPVRFVPVSDEGDATTVAAAIEEFEREGALGVVGPLIESLLDAAARSRRGPLPIVSPTASNTSLELEGVFSLTGIDPEAGRALGALVVREGVRSVVVLHPASDDMYEEARWFRQGLEAAGGSVLQTLTYPAGTTTFQPQLQEVVRVSPPGLVLLLPQGAGEVELLAPQVSFFGVRDSTGVRLFGNEAWTDAAVLESVQARHTDGVVAVTSWPEQGEFGPAWTRFVTAYEEHFRRTLRSPTPAWGYDAARLLLTASRLGGGSPAGTLRALREIRDFEGATGVLSVSEERIVRQYFPVRIETGRLVRLSP